MACCRAAWRRAAAGQTVSPAGLEGVGVGVLQLRSPPLRPSPLPYPWPQTASQVPTSPLHPLPPVGGTAGHVGLAQEAVPTSCQHPPQTLLSYTCSPPGPPSSLGRHLCPQPPWQRATSLHCFHPNPTASHRPVSPGVPEPLPAPSPLPSVPSAASLGMAPRALYSGSVSGQ